MKERRKVKKPSGGRLVLTCL